MGRSPLKRHHARAARLGTILGAVNAPGALVWLYAETDKGEHGYMPHYRRHLGPRRWRQQTVYEIGVGLTTSRTPGGSLAVWRDYLLRSRLVGIDLHPKDVRLGRRVSFEQADQGEPTDLQRVVDKHGPPDVVIDDGSHIGRHQIASFRCLWPLLNLGGAYVIEDLSTAYSPSFEGEHPAPDVSSIGLIRQLVNDTQADDPAFTLYPDHAKPPTADFADIAAVHTYPGIVFIEKTR